jgi:hypothetical protein
MDPSQWIAAFRVLHERVKKGDVPPDDAAKHVAMREELARSLASAQGLTVPVGQNARRHFRVAQVFPLEVNRVCQALTRDVSRSGFSALVPGAFREGEQVSFSIIPGRGQDPVQGLASVVSSVKQAGNSRVSFAVTSLEESAGDRLEMALFDAALARIK